MRSNSDGAIGNIKFTPYQPKTILSPKGTGEQKTVTNNDINDVGNVPMDNQIDSPMDTSSEVLVSKDSTEAKDIVSTLVQGQDQGVPNSHNPPLPDDAQNHTLQVNQPPEDNHTSPNNHLSQSAHKLNTVGTLSTIKWSEISTGLGMGADHDNRPDRPTYFLPNNLIAKISNLARGEIPAFESFSGELSGDQINNTMSPFPSQNIFTGTTLGELNCFLETTHGHFLVLAPIFGGGRGQRTESEVQKIIEFSMKHPNCLSVTVVTYGNRGADYLTPEQFAEHYNVLNFSNLSKSIRNLPQYKSCLVCKDIETLTEKNGSKDFPLTFHFLVKDLELPYVPSTKYITSTNTKHPQFRRLSPAEILPQLTPGLEKMIVVSGVPRDLITLGLSMKKEGLNVVKTYNASGDLQLLVNTEGNNFGIETLKQQGFSATKLAEFVVMDDDTIMAIQKKGVQAREYLHSPAVKKFARFCQPGGGCRISIVLKNKDSMEFLISAIQEGFQVFNSFGRMFPPRRRERDNIECLPLPQVGGEIELSAIPLTLKDDSIKEVLQTILPSYHWVTQKGSSPFNYSMLGYDDKGHVDGDNKNPPKPLTFDQIKILESALEKWGIIMTLDDNVAPIIPPKIDPPGDIKL